MPEYRISLDPRNPGQFFACCGLFELAELIAPGAEAAFGKTGTDFLLHSEAVLPPESLALETQADLDDKPYDATLEPLDLVLVGKKLNLNWWLNETLTDKSPLKTWGGKQTPRRVLEELLRRLHFSEPFDRLFSTAVYTESRFGVDARAAWEALDAGYSPTDESQAAATFPWLRCWQSCRVRSKFLRKRNRCKHKNCKPSC